VTAAQTVPDSPATAATGVDEGGSLLVGPRQLQAVLVALADAASCHDRHGGQPTVAAAYRRVRRRLCLRLATIPPPRLAIPVEAGESGPEPYAWRSPATLDGTSRVRLLSWLADTDPDLVARGCEWLAAEHAASVERARIRRNRRASLASRRRRADTS